MQRLFLGFAAGALLAFPASAQPAADPVDAMIENSRQLFGVPQAKRQTCSQSSPDEIVVCVDRPNDQRLPSSAQIDPNSQAGRRFRDGNIPNAPQFDHGSCRGQPNCFTGGWAPPPVYYVDVTALPAAPEGSDADKIAKGEVAAP